MLLLDLHRGLQRFLHQRAVSDNGQTVPGFTILAFPKGIV